MALFAVLARLAVHGSWIRQIPIDPEAPAASAGKMPQERVFDEVV
jgi:hypothetical protein